MYYLLVTVHVVICFFLIIIVLLQSGKAADLAGAFGGMGSQTAFGPRGAATVLSKATTIAAVLFMVTSITLSIVATRRGGTGASVLERQKTTSKPAPAKGSPGIPAAPGQPVEIELQPPTAKTEVQTVPAAPAQQPAPAPGHSDQHAPAPGHTAPATPPGHNAPAAKK